MTTTRQPPAARHRFRFGLRTLLVVVTVAAVGSWAINWWKGEYGSRWTKVKVERLIQSEVQPTWSRDQIQAWLTQKGFRPNYTTDSSGWVTSDGTVVPLNAGFRPSMLSGMLVGRVEFNVNVSFLFDGMISIYFFFDQNDVCVGHLVDEIIWGL